MVVINPGYSISPTRKYINLSNVPAIKTPGKSILLDPKALFGFLCQYTVPHGCEGLHYGEMLTNLGFSADPYGNYFRLIPNKGGKTHPRVAFMAHMDNSCFEFEKIKKVRYGKWLTTNGKTSLGADDRAGMAVLLYLATKNIPGLYCLFVGEEVGCVGSKFAADNNSIFQEIDLAISFDRKDKESIITHQCGIRTCSQEFANRLSEKYFLLGLEMNPDPSGLFTDSMSFSDVVPECTNISVGYSGAHGSGEAQDLEYLEKICIASAHIDWEDLPVERIPSLVEIIEDDSEEDSILSKIRMGVTVDLHELYSFITEEPAEAVIVMDKLLRGYHPSCL